MASVTATTLAYIAIAGTVVAGAASAYEQHQQGVAASDQAKQKARLAAESATGTQIQQRQNMLRALASQNAQAGAGGITTGGSFGANVKRQISENQNDLLTTQAGASAQAKAYSDQASNDRRSGNIGAAVSLLDTTTQTAKLLK